jgi:hypothetical protein
MQPMRLVRRIMQSRLQQAAADAHARRRPSSNENRQGRKRRVPRRSSGAVPPGTRHPGFQRATGRAQRRVRRALCSRKADRGTPHAGCAAVTRSSAVTPLPRSMRTASADSLVLTAWSCATSAASCSQSNTSPRRATRLPGRARRCPRTHRCNASRAARRRRPRQAREPVEQRFAYAVGRGAQAGLVGHGKAGALPSAPDDAHLASRFRSGRRRR